MKALLLLILVFVSTVRSTPPIQVNISTAEVNLGDGTRFRFTLFTLTLLIEPYLNGTQVSQLPLDLVSLTPNDDTGMPLAMVQQMGASQLVCPCTDVSCSDFSQCAAGFCNYTSDPQEITQQGPPDILLPLPAVQDPLYVIFATFGGEDVASLGLAALSNTLVFGMIQRSFDPQRSTWINYVPPIVNMSSCYIELFGNSTSTPIFYETNTSVPIGPVLAGGNNPMTPRTCNSTAFSQKVSELFAAITDIGNADTQAAMKTATWRVAAFLARDAWLGCEQMVKDLFVYSDISERRSTNGACVYDTTNACWLVDPCCNPQISFEQCCVARNVTVTETVVSDIMQSTVDARCATPTKSTLVLQQLAINMELSDLCENQLQQRGSGQQAWDTLTSFVQTCQNEVYGVSGQAPHCQTDADCWTKCDTTQNTCVVPFDNPEPVLVQCFVVRMNPELQRYLRRSWGLNASSPNSEMVAAFSTNLEDLGCQGPSGWQFNDHYVPTQVSNCSGLTNCQCISGQCVQNAFVAANETACLADVACNWDSMVNQTTCLAAPAQFCGECHGNSCWKRTQTPVCRTWPPVNTTCAQNNMTADPLFAGMCIVNTTDQSVCLPPDWCPPIVAGPDGSTYNCPAMCILNVSTSGDCLYEDAFADWTSNTQSGATVCRSAAPSLSLCQQLANSTWFPGGMYTTGILDTQPKCAAGICDMGPGLNQTQCETTHFCTQPCTICQGAATYPTTQCYDQTIVNKANCDLAGGVYQNNVCTFPWFASSRTACIQAGKQFDNCTTLTEDECKACDPTTGSGCILGSLKCIVNTFGQCPDQASCEASGVCDDWELQNWQDPFCQNASNALSQRCIGACVGGFAFDWSGNPTCPVGTDQSRIGCIYRNITDNSTCQTTVGTWVVRAFTEADCLAHGNGCVRPRFWIPTSVSQSQCSTCGGDYEPIYSWTAGNWVTGQMTNLTWVNTTWGSINQWTPSVNWTKLNDAISNVVATMVSKSTRSALLCEYNLISANLQTIACDCGDVPGSGCFDGGLKFAQLAVADLFSGLGITNQWGGVSVTTFNDTVSNFTDTLSFVISVITDYSNLASGLLGSPHRLGFNPPSIYEVVLTSDGKIYGQIVGSAVNISASNNTGPLQLCIAVNGAIAIDPAYTIYDFAIPRNSNASDLMALNISATLNTTQVCGILPNGTISGSTVIFPIIRANSVPTSTTTTTTTSTTGNRLVTTGREPIYEPEGATDGDTKAAIGISAGIGGLVVVIGVVVMCNMMKKSDGYYTVEREKSS